MKKISKDYLLNELLKLKIQAEFEDRKRGKKRWVSKVSAYTDLIKFIEDFWEEEENDDTRLLG